LEWCGEAKEFLESLREKLPGSSIDVDKAMKGVREKSEKVALREGAKEVGVEHVKKAVDESLNPPSIQEEFERLPAPARGMTFLLAGIAGLFAWVIYTSWAWSRIWECAPEGILAFLFGADGPDCSLYFWFGFILFVFSSWYFGKGLIELKVISPE
jgi:hypothetical protein